jgi:hypothetical protein
MLCKSTLFLPLATIVAYIYSADTVGLDNPFPHDFDVSSSYPTELAHEPTAIYVYEGGPKSNTLLIR